MTRVDFSKISTHPSAGESPGFLLWRISTRWRRAMEEALRPHSLTHPQFVMLAAVGWLTQGSETTTQAAVGKHADLDPNTTSQILRALEGKKLITRVAGADSRSKSPLLTAAGARLLKKALPTVEMADRDFFGEVSPRVLTTLQTLAG